jgi:hypothetical protein
MSRRENPAVADAIAVCGWDFETAPQETLRALVHLLRSILAIFDRRKVDLLRTSDLIESLSSIENHPRTELSSGYLHDAQKLARLLRPLHIRPKTLRFGHRTAKGYERRRFEKALVRVTEMSTTGRWPS